MTYREKLAWLSLLGLLVTFGPYFVITAQNPPAPNDLPNLGQMLKFGIAAGGYALLTGAAYLLARLGAGNGRMPVDERDLAIERRSMQAAYYVLMFGMLYVGCFWPFTERGWTIVNGTALVVVIAEAVRCLMAGFAYRRSAA